MTKGLVEVYLQPGRVIWYKKKQFAGLLYIIYFVSAMFSCTTYSSKIVLEKEEAPWILILNNITFQDVLGIPIAEGFQRDAIMQYAQKHFGSDVYWSSTVKAQSDKIPAENIPENLAAESAYKFRVNLSFYEKENLIAGAVQYNIIGFLFLLDRDGRPLVKVSHSQNYPAPLSSPSTLLHMSDKLFQLLKQREKAIAEYVLQGQSQKPGRESPPETSPGSAQEPPDSEAEQE